MYVLCVSFRGTDTRLNHLQILKYQLQQHNVKIRSNRSIFCLYLQHCNSSVLVSHMSVNWIKPTHQKSHTKQNESNILKYVRQKQQTEKNSPHHRLHSDTCAAAEAAPQRHADYRAANETWHSRELKQEDWKNRAASNIIHDTSTQLHILWRCYVNKRPCEKYF